MIDTTDHSTRCGRLKGENHMKDSLTVARYRNGCVSNIERDGAG